MSLAPPRWSTEELETARLVAIEAFRDQRITEPLEDYLGHFDEVLATFEDLLELTVDLSRVTEHADDLLADPSQTEAVRYLAGPPISQDDLKVVAEARLSAKAVRGDPAMARRVIETVLLGLDRRRFPWVAENRAPTEAERGAAAMASASLLASRRAMTNRANRAKGDQEQIVSDRLTRAGLRWAQARDIPTLDRAPGLGEFCGESLFGSRKADLVIRLWDRRVMPIECKVSNSSTNSVKRLNNDAAVKASVWLGEFGTAQTVPAAMLAGVFKRHNLVQAQDRGLALFWSHDLDRLIAFIDGTRA